MYLQDKLIKNYIVFTVPSRLLSLLLGSLFHLDMSLNSTFRVMENPPKWTSIEACRGNAEGLKLVKIDWRCWCLCFV